MSKILSIIAIVLLLGAGALGFLNKQKLDSATSELKEAQGILDDVRAEARTAEQARKEAEEELAAAIEQRRKIEDNMDDSATKLAEAQGQLDSLKNQIRQKEETIAELEEKLAAAPEQEAAPTAQPDDGLTERVAELEAALEAAEEENKILAAKLESEAAAVENLREAERMRQESLMAKSLEGTVLAYNPAWNFVVLSVGDRNGVVNNAEFLVTRGSQMLGRVKVTSVEPSTSIADVIPTSLTAGASIRPGDRVIVPPGS